MAQQTPVEFYNQALRKCLMGTVECDNNQILEDANKLFKNQIIEACIKFGNLNGVEIEDYEEYYNETYNK